MLEEKSRLVKATSTRQFAELALWVNRRKSHFLKGRNLADLHDLRIDDTSIGGKKFNQIRNKFQELTIKAVRYGESPQNTVVLAGALIPRAKVPNKSEI